MSRRRLKPRGEVVYHHVMTRTAQQLFWLEEPETKKYFVDLIDFYSQVYYIDILGHVCMDNHTHICLAVHQPDVSVEDIRQRHQLAQTKLANPRAFREELTEHFYNRYTDLSKFMWEINRRMAVAYNRRKGTKGHLWGGRYKNVVVEEGQSLLNVLAYIELNPVRAKIVEDPADFPYSSVGRIKEKLERNETVAAPAITPLNNLPEAIRASTYLDWIRYAAIAAIDPDLKSQSLPLQFTQIGFLVNMQAVNLALATRTPAGWSNSIYGSEVFKRKILIEMGWLVPLTLQKEPTQPKSSSAVA